MLFLIFSNADIKFAEKELTCRFYTVVKALSTTKQVELIDKEEFIKTALDKNFETFVMHVATLEVPLLGMTIHPLQKAQIAALKQDEALTKVLAKYSDFSDVFSKKEALVLSE